MQGCRTRSPLTASNSNSLLWRVCRNTSESLREGSGQRKRARRRRQRRLCDSRKNCSGACGIAYGEGATCLLTGIAGCCAYQALEYQSDAGGNSRRVGGAKMMAFTSSNASRRLPPYTSITACKISQLHCCAMTRPRRLDTLLFQYFLTLSWCSPYPICSVAFRVVHVFSVAFHVPN